MTFRILVLNETMDRVTGCFRARGCEVVRASLSSVAFSTKVRHGLAIPGIDGLPDAVVVRSISAGSFEAVTRRLGILHAFSSLSVPVWNSAKAIENCVDKSMTTFLLQRAGIPTPPTVAVEGLDAAREAAATLLDGGPLVLKPLFGAQGRGVRLVAAIGDLPGPDEVAGVYYLQRYVERDGPPFHDFRVFVCAGDVPAMMRRRGEDWVTNITRGATAEPFAGPFARELARLALASAEAVGAVFAGVDIVQAADGSFQVLEVNSMPAWTGLQSVSPVDIADTIAASVVASLKDRADGRTGVSRHTVP